SPCTTENRIRHVGASSYWRWVAPRNAIGSSRNGATYLTIRIGRGAQSLLPGVVYPEMREGTGIDRSSPISMSWKNRLPSGLDRIHLAANNTMQPTSLSVTPLAFARAAPLKLAADRERWAP